MKFGLPQSYKKHESHDASHFSFEWEATQRIHPRANSAGQLVHSPCSADSDDDEDAVQAVAMHQLTRLATSDLRNLELR